MEMKRLILVYLVLYSVYTWASGRGNFTSFFLESNTNHIESVTYVLLHRYRSLKGPTWAITSVNHPEFACFSLTSLSFFSLSFRFYFFLAVFVSLLFSPRRCLCHSVSPRCCLQCFITFHLLLAFRIIVLFFIFWTDFFNSFEFLIFSNLLKTEIAEIVSKNGV